MANQGKAKLWLVVLMSILALMAIGVTRYLGNRRQYDNPETSSPTNTTPKIPDSSQKQESPGVATTTGGATLNVFFSKHPESDEDPSKTFAVQYPNVSTSAVASYAIEQLVTGPNADLASKDYFSMVKLQGESTCNAKDFTLDIVNNVATLKFCRQFVSNGVVSDGQAKSELSDTLKQFANVTKVVILNIEGNCLFDLSGQNLCLK